MSKIALQGNASGTGTITITGTNTNSDYTITVPAESGTLVTTANVPGFPAGTVMLFAQTSAPTGWTKDTTNYNNSGLRVVTGSASTGGSVDFTTAFASQTPSGSVSVNVSGLSAGATTLTTTQIPSHTHTVGSSNSGSGSGGTYLMGWDGTRSNEYYTTGQATGGGGSHSHSISGSATGSFTGNAINLAVKYVDVIRATKD